MENENKEERSAVGLTRFHKLTIGIGIIWLGLMTWRYWSQYRQTESTRQLVFLIISAVLLCGMTTYLWKFSRKGI